MWHNACVCLLPNEWPNDRFHCTLMFFAVRVTLVISLSERKQMRAFYKMFNQNCTWEKLYIHSSLYHVSSSLSNFFCLSTHLCLSLSLPLDISSSSLAFPPPSSHSFFPLPSPKRGWSPSKVSSINHKEKKGEDAEDWVLCFSLASFSVTQSQVWNPGGCVEYLKTVKGAKLAF